MANDNRYGLGAGVWTTNVSRAHRVASRILAGMVGSTITTNWSRRCPGGVKESGIGKEAGIESFDDFSWIKTIGCAPRRLPRLVRRRKPQRLN